MPQVAIRRQGVAHERKVTRGLTQTVEGEHASKTLQHQSHRGRVEIPRSLTFLPTQLKALEGENVRNALGESGEDRVVDEILVMLRFEASRGSASGGEGRPRPVDWPGVRARCSRAVPGGPSPPGGTQTKSRRRPVRSPPKRALEVSAFERQ